ncbi:MAG: MFS transporter [Bradymonadales bacterium]|nr:MFS transporter [Bradymonadales bacterium]
MKEAEPNGEQDAQQLSGNQKRWRVNIFALTWLSYAGYYFCRKTFSIVKIDLRELMQLTDHQIAHIWTGFLVTYMLGQFLTAYLGRKVTCRLLLLWGMGASLLVNVGFGFFTHLGPAAFWPFFTFMLINGFAQGTGWGANIGVLAHWFRRKERGTVLAFWTTCYMLGSVMAKAFAAFMLGWLGLAWSFWGASLVLLAITALFYLFGRDRPEDYGLLPIVSEELAIDKSPQEGGGEAKGLVSLGWTRDVVVTVAVMGIAYFCFKFVRYTLDSWSPMLIEEAFGTSTEGAGYRSTIFDLLGFFGVIFGGFITDRFFKGSRTLVTFLMTIGMLAGVAFVWWVGMASMGLFLVGLGAIGFMLAGPDSLISGVGTIDVASKRGAVVAAAIINGVGSLGSIAQEQIVGLIKTHTSPQEGPAAVMLLLVGVSMAGVLLTMVLLFLKRSGRSRL